jgi:hypothetical protein
LTKKEDEMKLIVLFHVYRTGQYTGKRELFRSEEKVIEDAKNVDNETLSKTKEEIEKKYSSCAPIDVIVHSITTVIE